MGGNLLEDPSVVMIGHYFLQPLEDSKSWSMSVMNLPMVVLWYSMQEKQFVYVFIKKPLVKVGSVLPEAGIKGRDK